jgi:toxin secretion/phage lysis holin
MLNKMMNAKNGFFALLALAGSAVAQCLGGWDAPLRALLCAMAADYVTGLIVAGVFKRSGKSHDGSLSSHAGFQGLCKKGAQLLLVFLAVRLDGVMGGGFSRTAVILFFTANETLSVLENVGLMGVPYPAFLRDALEVLREQGDSGNQA